MTIWTIKMQLNGSESLKTIRSVVNMLLNVSGRLRAATRNHLLRLSFEQQSN